MSTLYALSPLFRDTGLEQVVQHHDPYDKSAGKRKRYSNRLVHQTGIPEDLDGIVRLTTHLYLAHIRTLLARCSVAQAAIYEVSRKPWTQDPEQKPSAYYAKMQKYALKAKNYAEKLDRWQLLARCDYWLGRAYGGTRDWDNAAKHLTLAKESDNVPAYRSLGWKGLRPSERSDVQFLLDDVNQRREARAAEATAVMKTIAEVESQNTARGVVDVLESDEKHSPVWLPERNRMVFAKNKEIALRRRLGNNTHNLDDEKRSQIVQEVEQKISQEWKEKGSARMIRKILTKEERCYVAHGTQWKKHSQYAGQRICPKCAAYWAKRRNKTDNSLASFASQISSSKPSPLNIVDLGHELGQTSWDSQRHAPPRMRRTRSNRRPSSERSSFDLSSTRSNSQYTSAPRASPVGHHDVQFPSRSFNMQRPMTAPITLGERRNLDIAPISTNITLKQGNGIQT